MIKHLLINFTCGSDMAVFQFLGKTRDQADVWTICGWLSPRHLLHQFTTLRFLFSAVLVVQLFSVQSLHAASNEHPNIVFILADDKNHFSIR